VPPGPDLWIGAIELTRVRDTTEVPVLLIFGLCGHCRAAEGIAGVPV
jgi:hypothetical protein